MPRCCVRQVFSPATASLARASAAADAGGDAAVVTALRVTD